MKDDRNRYLETIKRAAETRNTLQRVDAEYASLHEQVRTSVILLKKREIQRLLDKKQFAEKMAHVDQIVDKVPTAGYVGPYMLVGEASLLVEDLWDLKDDAGQTETKVIELLHALSEFGRKHEGILAYVEYELNNCLQRADRMLSELEIILELPQEQLRGKDMQNKIGDLYSEFESEVLSFRDVIESVLACLNNLGQDQSLEAKAYRKRLARFDERLRTKPPSIVKMFNSEYSPEYRSLTTPLTHLNQPYRFWWQRIRINMKGEPVWD